MNLFSLKQLYTACGAIAVGGAGLLYTLERSVKAEGMVMHPPKLPWAHNGPLSAYDHARYEETFLFLKSNVFASLCIYF